MTPETVWNAGRFDARSGPKRILFGRMYEDAEIERATFAPGARVFCIASAGCTALHLAQDHDVVACDINPAQLAYARRRLAGAEICVGSAEKVMGFGRALMPLAGWSASTVRAFLALDDTAEQVRFWKEHLDTWLFRTGLDTLFSFAALRAVYAPVYLDFLPPRFGAVLRARMERGFQRHPNAENPYAHALLMGEGDSSPASSAETAARIDLVHADAASYLEECEPGSFGGFTFSNILDGAQPQYRERLQRAMRRAAMKDAVVVLRSFREPGPAEADNRAALDRAMLWGIVRVREALDPAALSIDAA